MQYVIKKEIFYSGVTCLLFFKICSPPFLPVNDLMYASAGKKKKTLFLWRYLTAEPTSPAIHAFIHLYVYELDDHMKLLKDNQNLHVHGLFPGFKKCLFLEH